MKKLFSILCLLSLLIVALVSCDTPGDSHEHDFDDKWTSDEDYHWYACTVEGCKEKEKRAEHELVKETNDDGDPIWLCEVCGFEKERKNSAPEHEHEFDDEYSTSSNFHWYACNVEGCSEQNSKSEHQFGSPEITYADSTLTYTYTCVDCGYEKTETESVEAEVDDSVEWDGVFEEFKPTNFTLTINLDDDYVNYIVVDENGLYISGGGRNEMYIINDNGTWSAYVKNYDAPFMKQEASPAEIAEYYTTLVREAVLQVSFADNFDKFVFNEQTGAYLAEETIEAIAYDDEGEPMATLYCSNSQVKIANGKIISLSADYYISEGDDYSFIYENIGSSSVKVPQWVIDEANANSSAE